MTDLLTQLTGAAKVVFLGAGKLRYGESAVEELAQLKNATLARYPHADNTDAPRSSWPTSSSSSSTASTSPGVRGGLGTTCGAR